MVADARYKVRRRFPMRVYGRGTEPDARFSLANERTYLAWIRTSVALLAAGVALQVFEIGGGSGPSVLASTLLIVCSIVLPVAAWVSWAQTERSLREGAPLPAPSMAGPLAVVLALASGLVLGAILL